MRKFFLIFKQMEDPEKYISFGKALKYLDQRIQEINEEILKRKDLEERKKELQEKRDKMDFRTWDGILVTWGPEKITKHFGDWFSSDDE